MEHSQLLDHVLAPEAKTPAMDSAIAKLWLDHIRDRQKRPDLDELPVGWLDLSLEIGDDIPAFECQAEYRRAYEETTQ
jgi:hypothetical protein